MSKPIVNRRRLLRIMGAEGAPLATPASFTRGVWAQDFCNSSEATGRIVPGFNVRRGAGPTQGLWTGRQAYQRRGRRRAGQEGRARAGRHPEQY